MFSKLMIFAIFCVPSKGMCCIKETGQKFNKMFDMIFLSHELDKMRRKICGRGKISRRSHKLFKN